MNGIGIGSGIISQSKKSLPVPFKLRARKKMAALEEKLAEAVRQFPVLYDKSRRDLKHNSKKSLAWGNVAKQDQYNESRSLCRTHEVPLQGSQIHLDFSFLKILHAPTTFFFLGSVADVFFFSDENKKEWQKQQSLVISRVRHLECLQMKARLTIPLPSDRFTLDQNFLPIPTPLTTPLPSLPSLV